MQNYVCLRCLLRSPSTTRKPFKFVTEGHPERRSISSQTPTGIELKKQQIGTIGRLYSLKQKLQNGLGEIPKDEVGHGGEVPFDKLIAAIKSSVPQAQLPDVQTLEQVYSGKTLSEVDNELNIIGHHRRPSATTVNDDATIQILQKLGITPPPAASNATKTKRKTTSENGVAAKSIRATKKPTGQGAEAKAMTLKERRELKKQARVKLKEEKEKKKKVKATVRLVHGRGVKPAREKPNKDPTARTPPQPAPTDAMSIDSRLITQSALETDDMPKVPQLSFDLSRALFNPGVYQLRDPRSRVYNFDPYLENIMPVQQFNFDALNAYITSSEDQHLRNVALKHKKKYIGSSSSMSGAMSHFHFLLSAWRPLDMAHLSRRISVDMTSFTIITRAASSIFLRWRDGVYAVDADKEHDFPNILMMQGKSMEKLLTMEKDEFEKYRRSPAGEEAPAIPTEPEAYHYTGMENFLLRSQLDAYDPRLPGSGMFDLKTRAVAGIRMDMMNYEHGMGYQIKDRFGAWESYEREYSDMIRASFLKYSLQVRMGRMDGIFVAYHNITRIFGFQYVPITELDMCLHGQTDRILGDREFRITIKLMNDIFDRATQLFPQKSLRFMFETRDVTKKDPLGVMQIFVEAMEEEEIEKIQKAGKNKVVEFERKLTNPPPPNTMSLEESLKSRRSLSTLESSAADTAFLDEVLGGKGTDEPPKVVVPTEVKQNGVASWTLRIHNEVNGESVVRPQGLAADDRWVVKYNLERRGDDEAKKLYIACRNRRASAFAFDDNYGRNVFIENIRKLSAAGKTWREEQDAIDAEKGQVLLYNPQQAKTPDLEAESK